MKRKQKKAPHTELVEELMLGKAAAQRPKLSQEELSAKVKAAFDLPKADYTNPNIDERITSIDSLSVLVNGLSMMWEADDILNQVSFRGEKKSLTIPQYMEHLDNSLKNVRKILRRHDIYKYLGEEYAKAVGAAENRERTPHEGQVYITEIEGDIAWLHAMVRKSMSTPSRYRKESRWLAETIMPIASYWMDDLKRPYTVGFEGEKPTSPAAVFTYCVLLMTGLEDRLFAPYLRASMKYLQKSSKSAVS